MQKLCFEELPKYLIFYLVNELIRIWQDFRISNVRVLKE